MTKTRKTPKQAESTTLDKKMLTWGKPVSNPTPEAEAVPQKADKAKTKKLVILSTSSVDMIKRVAYWDRIKDDSTVVEKALEQYFRGLDESKYPPIPKE